jgi:peptide/nickel transport system permease protein
MMSMNRVFRNKPLITGCVLVMLVIVVAIFAPHLSIHDPYEMNFDSRLELPSKSHWLGTDNFGRDLWSRIALGTRVSAIIAILSVSVSAILGTLVGLYAGYKGGWFDLVIMRIVDIFLGFPVLLLALALVAALGPGVKNIVIALIFVYWGRFTRIVRAETLSVKENEYVIAARTSGASTTRILFVHILRNIWGPPLVFGTLSLGTAILTETALSFLGFGASPPTPTWGWIMAYGLRYIQTVPWFSIVPGLAIMITVLGFNLLGDGLQEYLDPKNHTL